MRISDWSSDVCSSDPHGDCSRHRQPDRWADGPLRIGQNSRPRHTGGDRSHTLWRKPPVDEGRDPETDLVSDFDRQRRRSEEQTSELQSLMRISYAVFCLKKKHNTILIQTRVKQRVQI